MKNILKKLKTFIFGDKSSDGYCELCIDGKVYFAKRISDDCVNGERTFYLHDENDEPIAVISIPQAAPYVSIYWY
jgi:hypothetical protein